MFNGLLVDFWLVLLDSHELILSFILKAEKLKDNEPQERQMVCISLVHSLLEFIESDDCILLVFQHDVAQQTIELHFQLVE